jgi:hypothetical protein
MRPGRTRRASSSCSPSRSRRGCARSSADARRSSCWPFPACRWSRPATIWRA